MRKQNHNFNIDSTKTYYTKSWNREEEREREGEREAESEKKRALENAISAQ